MTAPLLIDLAVLMVATADHMCPEVVSRPAARTLHLQRNDGSPRLRDFTDCGALLRGLRPMCGQRARRWYRTPVDGRPLCRRCARAAERFAASRGVTRQVAAQRLAAADIAAALRRAQTDAAISQLMHLACEAGLIAATVPAPGGPVRLTQLVRDARRRVTRAQSAVDQRDRNWADRLNPPGSRYPRRYR